MPDELFASLAPTPLAERMRPKALDEILGQDHLLGPEGPLGRMLAARKLSSLILWGPPGCGKTTIARLLAESVDLHFEPLSAVFSGVADLRRIFEAARQRRKDGKGTCCSSTRSTVSTAPSRTAFCPMSRTARSPWSAPRRKTPRSS